MNVAQFLKLHNLSSNHFHIFILLHKQQMLRNYGAVVIALRMNKTKWCWEKSAVLQHIVPQSNTQHCALCLLFFVTQTHLKYVVSHSILRGLCCPSLPPRALQQSVQDALASHLLDCSCSCKTVCTHQTIPCSRRSLKDLQ